MKMKKKKIVVKKRSPIRALPNKNLIFAALLFTLINFLFVFIFQNSLPPEVPLFYGLPEGAETLTGKQNLFIPGVISLGFVIFNSLLIFVVEEDFLKKTLVATSFLISALALITTIKIALLVGNI